MGADLFESFVGSLVGAMILGLIVDTPDSSLKLRMMLLPLLISVVGLAASLIGTFFVRAKPGSNPQRPSIREPSEPLSLQQFSFSLP